MAANPKSLAKKLTQRGPHTVLRGDLALAGLPGVIHTPAEGFDLPAVAFGHGWLTDIARYSGLFEHLASWGFVVAAPGTERSPVPSAIGLSADLLTALDVCTGVRLGTGRISVQPHRLALVGHGMGAGAALLAAARRPVAAVAALYPSPTSPSASEAAARVDAPGLVLVGENSLGAMNSDAVAVTRAWGGDAVLRVVDDADDEGMVEGRRLLGVLGFGGAQRRTQQRTRALLTGFLLHRLTDDKTYAAFSDPEAEIPGSTSLIETDTIDDDLGARLSRLFSH